ncbi:hypothetical protein [Neisseria sp.]
MNNEVEVIDVVAQQNHQAAYSVMVMEQWGNGEVYSEGGVPRMVMLDPGSANTSSAFKTLCKSIIGAKK